ncbi:MAG: hypothetical protein A3E87_03960 [Gammaproteobacteria bacterium RIFCSPHIGHO2_12_FULL_35_23]|nr:MAG: hypothetical protein A3E87_03960 [Gammaproteobacteria bacterium RIFCSPHIGHO2_12_FULL_35_23]
MKINLRPWFIWGLGAAFFFIEYFARIAPSIMAPDLMRTFNVTAFGLGSLSAYFYTSYLGMQIPVGMLIDKYGLHKLLTISAFICFLSCIGFAVATNLHVAELCRFTLGFGAAFAFVSALKLALIGLPQRWFGLLAGITQALGMLGASVGDGPMSIIVVHYGWRFTMGSIGFIFLILSILIFIFVRDKKNIQKNFSYLAPKLWHSFIKVVENKHCWFNAAFAGLIYAPTAAFAELWGVSFLSQGYQLTQEKAAFAVGLIFIGWGVGGPLAGWISDRIGKRKPIMKVSGLCGVILLSLLIYYPNLSTGIICLLLFLYGFTNTGLVASYAVAGEICTKQVAGTSLAFANIASVLIGAVFQPLIGRILDLHWQQTLVNGVRIYSLADYRMALFALPACSLLSLLVLTFVKETYCNPIE